MIRRPTPENDRYGWHRQALADAALHLELSISGDEPQCGWYKTRLAKGGPWVPARIWMYQPTDAETGELDGDETLQCEIDGRWADAGDKWIWLCQHPITEAEFNYLTAARQWAQENAPDEPLANPRQRVDWLKVPTPQFIKRETTT